MPRAPARDGSPNEARRAGRIKLNAY